MEARVRGAAGPNGFATSLTGDIIACPVLGSGNVVWEPDKLAFDSLLGGRLLIDVFPGERVRGGRLRDFVGLTITG